MKKLCNRSLLLPEAIKIEAVASIAAIVLYKAHQAYLKNQAHNKAVQKEEKIFTHKLDNSLALSSSILVMSITTYGICSMIKEHLPS